MLKHLGILNFSHTGNQINYSGQKKKVNGPGFANKISPIIYNRLYRLQQGGKYFAPLRPLRECPITTGGEGLTNPWGGSLNSSTLLLLGDRQIREVIFAQIFSPPPPVVNGGSLTFFFFLPLYAHVYHFPCVPDKTHAMFSIMQLKYGILNS